MLDMSFDPIWALKQGYTVVTEYPNNTSFHYKIIDGKLKSKCTFYVDDFWKDAGYFVLGVDVKCSLIPPEPPI